MRFAGKLIVALGFLLALSMSFNNAEASELKSYNATIDVSSEMLAFIQIRAAYTSVTTDKLSFLFFNEFSNFKAADSKGLLKCVFSTTSVGIEVLCDPNENRKAITQSNPYVVSMSFDAHDVVVKKKKPFIFFVHLVADPTESLRLKMLLPEGTVLPDSAGAVPYYPENAVIGSTGRRVILEWNFQKPALGSRLNLTVQYESSSSTLFAISAAIIVLLLLAIVALFYYKTTHSKVAAIISILRGDEKKVVDVLRQHGGNCKQREIVKETDFSKAKVSRILTLLEERGLLYKDRKGRTNKVFLAEGGSGPKKKEVKPEEKQDSSKPTKEEPATAPETEFKKPFGQ